MAVDDRVMTWQLPLSLLNDLLKVFLCATKRERGCLFSSGPLCESWSKASEHHQISDSRRFCQRQEHWADASRLGPEQTASGRPEESRPQNQRSKAPLKTGAK